VEPLIPQHIYGSVYKLRNGWFHNTFGHLPMSCGTTHSATHWEVSERVAEPPIPQLVYGSVYMLRNGWFRNTFEYLVVLLHCYSVAPPLFDSSAAAADANFSPSLPPTTLHHHHHLTFDLPPQFTVLSFLKIKDDMVIYEGQT